MDFLESTGPDIFMRIERGTRSIIGGSSNGRTSGFGPDYLGSSPSPPAMSTKTFTFRSLTNR